MSNSWVLKNTVFTYEELDVLTKKGSGREEGGTWQNAAEGSQASAVLPAL